MVFVSFAGKSLGGGLRLLVVVDDGWHTVFEYAHSFVDKFSLKGNVTESRGDVGGNGERQNEREKRSTASVLKC